MYLSSLPIRKKNLTLSMIIIFYMAFFTVSNLYGNDVDQQNRFTIQLEAGPVWQGRNDVQIPNNENGTRFSLVDLVGNGPYPAIRLYFNWHIAARHKLRLLLAPLRYTESGSFSSPVSFAGETYDPNQAVNGTYQFNSWRITYAYKFHDGDNWQWWIGFTAKIRDAVIKLEQEATSSEKTDLGFVPLLHLRGEYHINPTWWVMFDIDALAGGPGRAEDGTIQVGYTINDQWSVSAGYRTVEGGANVEEVYNFAWFHYAVAGLNFKF